MYWKLKGIQWNSSIPTMRRALFLWMNSLKWADLIAGAKLHKRQMTFDGVHQLIYQETCQPSIESPSRDWLRTKFRGKRTAK